MGTMGRCPRPVPHPHSRLRRHPPSLHCSPASGAPASLPRVAGARRGRHHRVLTARHRESIPHEGGVRPRTVSHRRQRCPSDTAAVARRRHDRGDAHGFADRRRPELPHHQGRQPVDGGSAGASVRPPREDGTGVLHVDQDRLDPIASGQRRRRGAVRPHVHGVEHPVERRHRDRVPHRNAAAVVAADASRGRTAPPASSTCSGGSAPGDGFWRARRRSRCRT